MVFVDTGAWYALYVPTDRNCRAAHEWLQDNRRPLVTIDYIMTETLNLLNARGERRRAVDFGTNLLQGRLARVEYVTASDIGTAFVVFSRHDDKDWSFTDCVSRAVMSRLNVKTAFAFDVHFRQFGNLEVVPA